MAFPGGRQGSQSPTPWLVSRELSPQRGRCNEHPPLYPRRHRHGIHMAPGSWWLQRDMMMRNEGGLSSALKD